MKKLINPVFYHHYCHNFFLGLFFIALISQVFFWKKTDHIRVRDQVVPHAPSNTIVKILSFGDQEFLFRILATNLQNLGDVYAGFLSLKKYDYSRLYLWMKALDQLNHQSRLIPSLASYYYANNDNPENIKFIVRYLDEHASVDIDQYWWWMFQAIQITRINLKDQQLAKNLAEKLAKNQAVDAPLWTKQLTAFISKEQGDDCMAFQVINKLIKDSENSTRPIKPEEMNFMRYFINQRLISLKQKKFDPRKCNNPL